MHPSLYLPLLVAWVVTLVMPGPDVLTVLRMAAGNSRRAGVLTSVGVVTGLACWITAALAGVTALLDRYERVYLTLRLAGALFLIGYGVTVLYGAWRRRRARGAEMASPVLLEPGADEVLDPEPTGEPAARRGGASAWRAWRLGLLCNLSNPKILVFFSALFATVLPPHLDLTEQAGIVAAMLALGLAWFVLVAVVASQRAARAAYRRASRTIETVSGGLFVAVGGALVPR